MIDPKLSDTSKMSPAVRRLYGKYQLGLSLRKLADLLGVSHQAVKGWFDGTPPSPAHEKAIAAAVEKIEAEYPDPVMETLPSGAQVSGVWSTPDDPDDEEIAAEVAFRARLRIMFNLLQAKMTDSEKRILAVSWVGFAEVVMLAEKYGVSVPKK